MNEQEKAFINSIQNKLKTYSIPLTLEKVLNQYSGIFTYTKYNNGKTELVDARIERYLVKNSFYYFIKKYAYVEIPGIGLIPFEPYYFQEELAKKVTDYLKIVTEKSRQVGISTFFVLYVLWRANFHESENIDVVSLKQQKAQAFVSKMMPTLENLPEFLKTEVVAKNTQYIKFQFPNGATSMILSEAQSENAGRSDSLSLLVIDEAAFMRSKRMIEGIVASAQPTLSKTGGQMVVISTSNGIVGPGEWYYNQVQQAKYGDELNTLFVPIAWFEVPDDPNIKGPKKGYNDILQKFISLDYFNKPEVRQEMEEFFKPIGEKEWKTNPWLKKQYDDLQDVRYKQEVLRKFIVGGDKVFTEENLEKLEKRTKDPIAKNEFGGTEYKGLWFWRYPQDKHKYIIACLPKGEKVLTNFGLKNIENINFNDKLIDKDGNLTNIKNIQISNYNNDIFGFKLEGIYRKTYFTHNHPILSSINTTLKRKHGGQRYWDFSFNFNNAEDISKGDWLIYPNVYKNNIISDEEILSYWNVETRKDFIINNPLLDENFWWYVGIWLAEGWINKRHTNKQKSFSIETAHNLKEEKNYAIKIKNIFSKYNRAVSLRENKENNTIRAKINSSQIVSFLENNFGKYASGKKIPEWVKKLPERFKLKLIEGYLNGDGCISIDSRRNKYNTLFVSISLDLLEGIQDILFSIGIISSLSLLRNEGKTIFPDGKVYKTKKTYQLSFRNDYSIELMKKLNMKYLLEKENINRRNIKNNFFSEDLNYIYIRIKHIEKKHYKGKVYNFETESHTYNANYISTHNCDAASGTSKDYSAIQILDVEAYEQVAEYKGHIQTKNFAHLIKKLALYYNEAYVVVEANSIGEAVFGELYYGNDPYQYMYRIKKTKNGITRFTGWETNVKTRQLIMNDLVDWLANEDLSNRLKVYSKRLWEEISLLVWETNSRMAAASGANDDAVVAMALAIHLRGKAETGGESFLITEDGTMVESSKDKSSADEKDDGLFGIYRTDESEDVMMERENIDWITEVWK